MANKVEVLTVLPAQWNDLVNLIDDDTPLRVAGDYTVWRVMDATALASLTTSLNVKCALLLFDSGGTVMDPSVKYAAGESLFSSDCSVTLWVGNFSIGTTQYSRLMVAVGNPRFCRYMKTYGDKHPNIPSYFADDALTGKIGALAVTPRFSNIKTTRVIALFCSRGSLLTVLRSPTHTKEVKILSTLITLYPYIIQALPPEVCALEYFGTDDMETELDGIPEAAGAGTGLRNQASGPGLRTGTIP